MLSVQWDSPSAASDSSHSQVHWLKSVLTLSSPRLDNRGQYRIVTSFLKITNTTEWSVLSFTNAFFGQSKQRHVKIKWYQTLTGCSTLAYLCTSSFLRKMEIRRYLFKRCIIVNHLLLCVGLQRNGCVCDSVFQSRMDYPWKVYREVYKVLKWWGVMSAVRYTRVGNVHSPFVWYSESFAVPIEPMEFWRRT